MTFTTFHHAGLALNLWDDGGPGLPVLFQHGLCGAEGQVADVFPATPTYRRLTLECRGHGRSDPGPLAALSIATFTDDLIALIERHIHRPVVIGGISMGAAIASRLAVTRPDLVRALILARPAWITDHPPALARTLFGQSDIARDLAAEAPDNLTSLLGFFDRTPHDVTAALLTFISADGPGITTADLRALAIPTLVLGHTRDVIHPLPHAIALAELIPAARLVRITPKSIDRARYIADLQAALAAFLGALR